MAPYRYTSGRMLHYHDCMHFLDDQPARLATDEELRRLPVCSTCAAQSSGAAHGAGTFVCPSCGLTQRTSMRSPSGLCRDCE